MIKLGILLVGLGLLALVGWLYQKTMETFGEMP